jgi:hypothetical protein
VADAGSSPKTKALADVLDLFAKQSRDLTATPEPEKPEPVPKWLTDALLYVVDLPTSRVEQMSLEEGEGLDRPHHRCGFGNPRVHDDPTIAVKCPQKVAAD